MDINLEDLKTFSEVSRPVIEPIINSLIKPHIDRLNKWLAQKDKKDKVEDNYWENKFRKYLEVLYKDSSFVTTLVFPNSQTKLKELYVPLTLIRANSYENFKIETFNYSLFDKYGKLIISDYAGMGKSTILKWITISIIEQNKGVPIVVELRKLDSNHSIVDEILTQINPLDNSFDKDLVFQLLELGFFTILLDGFDEIPYDTQDKITIQLNDFIKKASKNNVILTSRPESALSTFAGFQLFYIKPLEEREAYLLIEKLDGLSKVKFGKNLIEEVKERNSQVKEFLTNPFLVSLLYKSYTYNKDIPSKKITFYEEVYECLFKHHDLSKEGFKRPKRSRLDIFDFEIVLRDIAFETSKVGRVIYSKDEMINYISSAKSKNTRIDFKEQNFYDDLTTTVPIFTMEGVKIKWAHKSIQDFFSAKYISNHIKKEEIIDVIFKSGKYHYLNILDLLYELEYKIFKKIIIKPILEEFIEFYESQFKITPDVPQNLIDERVALVFGSKCCLLKLQMDIGFENAREVFANAIGANSETFRPVATFRPDDPCYYSMNELSLRKEIIRILRLKNENLFMENRRVKVGIIEDHLNMFEFDVPYVLNDDITKPFNHPDLFLIINDLISSNLQNARGRRKLSFNLDYKKCKRQLILINKEIENDEAFDLLSNI